MAPLVFVLLISVGEFVLSLFLPAAFPGTRDTLKFVNGLATWASRLRCSPGRSEETCSLRFGSGRSPWSGAAER